MDLKTSIELDTHDVVLAELGESAIYRPRDDQDGAGFPTRVIVMGAPEQSRENKLGARGSVLKTHESRRHQIQAPAVHSGETVGSDPAGDRGGIVSLEPGDTFEVPESIFGNATLAGTVKLRVAGNIQRPTGAGWWIAEVMR